MVSFKNIWIVEDELLAAERIRKMIAAEFPNSNIMGPIESISEGIEILSKSDCDLLFMDIHLTDGLSFKILEAVNLTCPIIFTTAYDQYAIQAFKHEGIDYLLKPIRKDDLSSAISKAEKLQKKLPEIDYSALAEAIRAQKKDLPKRILLKYGQKIKTIEIKDVAYFYNHEKTLFVVTKLGGEFPIDDSLDQWITKLDQDQFFRINRKMIVSFEAIENMSQYSRSRILIKLNPPFQEMVLVSTDRAGNFKNWLIGK